MLAHQAQAISLAEAELAKRAGEKADEDEKERLGKRQANLAVALLRMGKADSVWPLLRFSPDPTNPQLLDPLDKSAWGAIRRRSSIDWTQNPT